MDDPLRLVFFGIHFLVTVALIVLVALQSSRSEGLGAVGGQSSGPTMRGRQGVDEQLAVYTKYVAGTWMFLSLVLYLASLKFGWQ